MTKTAWTDAIGSSRPLLALTISSLTSFGLILWLNGNALRFHTGALTLSLFGWFLLGIAYTHFFEYGYHRFVMHARAPWAGFVKRNHLQHHKIFYGDNFRSRRREDWQYIASPWYVFPGLLFIHYAPLSRFLTPWHLVAFFAGVLPHYLLFEWTHWLTHVEDNAIDPLIARVPLLGAVRAYQIREHRYHHEIPTVDFNFNPPFLGDVVCGTLKVPPADGPTYPQSLKAGTGSSR
jgi:hypothetical protein